MARILVIDDNGNNLQLAVYLLTRFGHEVRGVAGADFALELLGMEEFDLLLVDVQMPVMDGFEFARCLRNDRRQEWLPLVALTAHAMVGDRERILAAGFDGYIAKPIDPERFVAQVEEFIRDGRRQPQRV